MDVLQMSSRSTASPETADLVPIFARCVANANPGESTPLVTAAMSRYRDEGFSWLQASSGSCPA
jgi:hypothetical protein